MARHQGLIAVLVAAVVVVALGVARAEPPSDAPGSPVVADGSIRGVEGDTIRIALYQPPEDDPVSKIVADFIAPDEDNALVLETVEGLVEMFEAQGNTGDWHVELVPFTGSGNLLDTVAARADAVTIAEEIQPFMVWSGPLLGTAFAEELAARGVMCIMCVTSGTNAFYEESAPFVWSLQTSPEQVGTHTAEYVSKRLAGRTASFAGDPAIAEQERRFGLLYMDGPFGGDGLGRALGDQLRDVGVDPAATVAYTEPFAIKQIQSTLIARLKHEGVTTVIYGGEPLSLGSLQSEATAQGWFPEWLVTGSFSSERNSWGRNYDQAQMAHTFGITPLPLPSAPEFSFVHQLYKTFHGTDIPAGSSALQQFAAPALFYAALRVAGDDLSPGNFQRALFEAPPIGGEGGESNPLVPTISFGRRGYWPYADYAGIDDFAEIWWDADAVGPDENGDVGTGMWAFTDAGARYLPGEWPTGPPHAFDEDVSWTEFHAAP